MMNVADEGDVVSRVRDIVSSFGHFDHVFNCAGVNPTAMALVDTPSAYFDKLVGVNLKGVCKWTRSCGGAHTMSVCAGYGWDDLTKRDRQRHPGHDTAHEDARQHVR